MPYGRATKQAAARNTGAINSYPHMCRDGHIQIGHADSEHEQCPLCRAMAALQFIAELPAVTDVSGKMAEQMSYTAKAALSSIA